MRAIDSSRNTERTYLRFIIYFSASGKHKLRILIACCSTAYLAKPLSPQSPFPFTKGPRLHEETRHGVSKTPEQRKPADTTSAGRHRSRHERRVDGAMRTRRLGFYPGLHYPWGYATLTPGLDIAPRWGAGGRTHYV